MVAELAEKENGFTLLELLVVVAIIGVLVAIAIPQFSAYQQRSFDARAKSDLITLAIAEEAYYTDNEAYKACASTSNCESILPNLSTSPGVTMAVALGTEFFTATAAHPKGTSTYSWNSIAGGLQ